MAWSKEFKRDVDVCLDIEGVGLEGTVGEVIWKEIEAIVRRHNLTTEDIEKYKGYGSSYYDKDRTSTDPFVVLETYVVDQLEYYVTDSEGER